MIDYEKLQEGLTKLRGLDFEEAERAERAAKADYISPNIAFSKSFQARLAAQALGINYHDLKNLPLKEYLKVTTAVFNFLFATETTQLEISED